MAALAPRVGTPASSTFSGRSVGVRGRRGRSSVGRAPQSHCGGQGFKSPRLHQRNFRPAPPSARSGIACCARRKRDQQTRHLQVHGRPELDKITTALRTACPAHRALASRPAAASAALAVVRAPAADNGKAFSGPRRPWQDEWAAPLREGAASCTLGSTFFLKLWKSARSPTCLTNLVAKPFICSSGSCGAWRKTGVPPFTSIGATVTSRSKTKMFASKSVARNERHGNSSPR
jgi:hypothetical protein